MADYQFNFILKQFEKIFYRIAKGFDFIYDVITLFLNCEYINDEDKEIIRKVMYNFEKHEKELI